MEQTIFFSFSSMQSPGQISYSGIYQNRTRLLKFIFYCVYKRQFKAWVNNLSISKFLMKFLIELYETSINVPKTYKAFFSLPW